MTNTYRLGRAGRLRADLGGVYFNGLFLVGVAAAYHATGYEPLLVAVLAVNLEIVQQLLPTLRFDGYYIVADLVGIPDLFKYIGPILKRVVLRRPADTRLQVLKRWPQRLVTAWVLFVIPALAVQLGYLTLQLPRMIESDRATIEKLIEYVAAVENPLLGAASATVQTLVLALPVVGVIVILWQLARAGTRLARRHLPTLTTHLRAGLPSLARLIPVRPARRAATAGSPRR